MANEINIQAIFTYQRYAPMLEAAGSVGITQTGNKFAGSVFVVTTGGATTLQIDGTTPLAYIFVKNLDAAAWNTNNYVDVGTDNPPTEIIARLRAGEFCLVPMGPVAVLYAKATGINADILFCAAEA